MISSERHCLPSLAGFSTGWPLLSDLDKARRAWNRGEHGAGINCALSEAGRATRMHSAVDDMGDSGRLACQSRTHSAWVDRSPLWVALIVCPRAQNPMGRRFQRVAISNGSQYPMGRRRWIPYPQSCGVEPLCGWLQRVHWVVQHARAHGRIRVKEIEMFPQ